MLSLRDAILLAIALPMLVLAIGLGYAAHGTLPTVPYHSVEEMTLSEAVAAVSTTPAPRYVPTARPRIVPTELPQTVNPAEFYGAEWPIVDVEFDWESAVPLCHYPEESVASNIARDSTFTYQHSAVARLHTELHGLDYIPHSGSTCYEESAREEEEEESYSGDDDEDPWGNWVSD